MCDHNGQLFHISNSEKKSNFRHHLKQCYNARKNTAYIMPPAMNTPDSLAQ